MGGAGEPLGNIGQQSGFWLQGILERMLSWQGNRRGVRGILIPLNKGVAGGNLPENKGRKESLDYTK